MNNQALKSTRIGTHFVLILILSVFMLSFAYASQEPKPIRFGSVAMDIPAVMHKRLIPLTRYLSDTLERPVILTLSPNMEDAIQNVVNGRVDLAYLTPVAYIRSHDQGNTRLIVKTVTDNKASFQLMIVARESGDIHKVEDLAGKSFAFGDKAALLQRAVVVGAGMPMEKLGSYQFLGHYDNIVRAVLNNDFDAGILKDTKAFAWAGKGVRIIYSSPHLPPYNIAATSNMSDEVYQQIKKAFLDLNVNDRKHLSVIKALSKNYSGFEDTSDAEYDVVRKLTAPFNQ